MTKKEMVTAILDIEEVDTKSNLMKLSNDKLQSILSDLEEKTKYREEPQEEAKELAVDKNDLMEQFKAEMEEMKKQMYADIKKEVEEEMKSKEEVSENATPTPIRKKDIDRFEPIPVMSVSVGKLIYVSKKTGAEWIWGDYGDVEHIEFQELISMRSGQKRFLNEPFIIILDEDVVNYLGLNKAYENMKNLESLDDIFNLSQREFQDVVEKSPKGIRHSIILRARQKVEDGTLDSMKKIKYLNEKFNTDIGQRG